MPFYEGIGLIAEKNAVVLDLGVAYAKVGYAGEAAPRAIIKVPKSLEDWQMIGEDKSKEEWIKFVHSVYFQHLLVNPKDRRVVLIDNVIKQIKVKEMLSDILFKHFEALSILYAPSHLMPLFTLGQQNGLVLDVGYKEATLIPIYQGVPILKAWQAQPLASEAIHKEIRQMLLTKGTIKIKTEEVRKMTEEEVEKFITDDIVEDIKVRLCFVTNMSRGHQIQKIREDASSVSGLSSFLKKAVPSCAYPVAEDAVVYVDGSIRESACEVLFVQDNDGMSIATMFLDSLLTVPLDTRRELADNIIFVGGTTQILGFKARLIEEITHLLTAATPYKDQLSPKLSFKVHQTPTKANFTNWTGASNFGATDAIGTRAFTKEMYLKENGSVPDWSNLRFNSLFEGNEDKQG